MYQRTERQDGLCTGAAPSHSGALEPLRDQRLAGGLDDARADGQMTGLGVGVAHAMTVAPEVSQDLADARSARELLALIVQRSNHLLDPDGVVEQEVTQLVELGAPSRIVLAIAGVERGLQLLGGVVEIHHCGGFAGAIPLFGGAAVRSALCEPRCGDSVAAPAWGVHRPDASGRRRTGGRTGRARTVGERGQSARAQLGRGVPAVVPSAPRRRLGLPVGGRHLQRASRRARAAVRAGGHRRERPRREALSGHRGRGARVHPELAQGAAGDEAARLHPPGEACRGRRSDGVLVGALGSVSIDPNAVLLDAQDRQRPELPSEVRPDEGQAGAARDLDARNEGHGPDAHVVSIGPALIFERLWRETGCQEVVRKLLTTRHHRFDVERAVFMSVLHRLMVSGSDRSALQWRRDQTIDGCAGLELQHLYRAMGWLGEALGEREPDAPSPRRVKDLIEEELFARRRDLFSALDLVFFDTTSLFFTGNGGDTLGQYGKSKDHRSDCKQMVLGMVIDGDGMIELDGNAHDFCQRPVGTARTPPVLPTRIR